MGRTMRFVFRNVFGRIAYSVEAGSHTRRHVSSQSSLFALSAHSALRAKAANSARSDGGPESPPLPSFPIFVKHGSIRSIIRKFTPVRAMCIALGIYAFALMLYVPT